MNQATKSEAGSDISEETLSDLLDQALIASASNTDKELFEWLRYIYLAKSEQFKHDNGTIWVTGAIFIPVAFGVLGFALNAKLPPMQLILACIGSIGFLSYWMIIARNCRQFQNKSMLVMKRIEEKFIGFIDPLPAKIPDNSEKYSLARIRKQSRKLVGIRNTQNYILFGLVAGWAALAFIQFGTPDFRC
jgi:hypothetical protein